VPSSFVVVTELIVVRVICDEPSSAPLVSRPVSVRYYLVAVSHSHLPSPDGSVHVSSGFETTGCPAPTPNVVQSAASVAVVVAAV
jgi:hypothetical protein